MNTTLTLTKASIKAFARNRQALLFTLVSPLLIMLIFGLIGFDRAPKFDVGLIATNPQPGTQQLVNQLKKMEILKIQEGDRDSQLKELRDGNLSVVLEVPDDFIGYGVPVQPKTLTVYINESEQSQAQAVVSILSTYLDKTTLALVHAPEYFKLDTQVVDSKHLKYLDFLLPGLIAMSVMQMSVFSVAMVFVQYKEKGVLKRLLATPMRPYQFVTANVVTRLIVSVLQTVVFITVGVLVLKAHIIGSYPLILLCVILGSLMFLGLGFTISGFAKTIDSVPAFANLIILPMLFLGGTFFPISSMPAWLQKIAQFLPLTHFSGALRDVMTKGADISAIMGHLGVMALWSAILITAATYSFSFQEKDSV